MGKGSGGMSAELQQIAPGKGGAAAQQTPGPQQQPQQPSAPPGSVQAGQPFAQGQALYSQPYMAAGLGSLPTAGAAGGAQRPGPYSFQSYGGQGVDAGALAQGMQNYYTPIPQQMPQSPYLAGYTYGGNAPPSNPQPGDALPLAPIQPNQIPQSTSVKSALGNKVPVTGGGYYTQNGALYASNGNKVGG